MHWSSLLSDFNVQFELFFTTVENANASGDEDGAADLEMGFAFRMAVATLVPSAPQPAPQVVRHVDEERLGMDLEVLLLVDQEQ